LRVGYRVTPLGGVASCRVRVPEMGFMGEPWAHVSSQAEGPFQRFLGGETDRSRETDEFT
jgi:hypothetical protein